MPENLIVDIHAHVFPEAIAQKAVQSISTFYDLPAKYNGTVSELMQAYHAADINKGCVFSVALTPRHIPSINRFIAETVRSSAGKLIGFAAIHPMEKNMDQLISDTKENNLKAFKIHPDMQKFALDDPDAMNMFAAIEGKKPILIHMGDPRFEYSHPKQLQKVLDAFPNLICICAHLGGWSEWEDAWKILSVYENVFVDTSSSLYAMTADTGRKIIRQYSRERILFGTDFPMWDPKEELDRLLNLHLSTDETEHILFRNAENLLGIS